MILIKCKRFNSICWWFYLSCWRFSRDFDHFISFTDYSGWAACVFDCDSDWFSCDFEWFSCDFDWFDCDFDWVATDFISVDIDFI
jgi:hypothetical protein